MFYHHYDNIESQILEPSYGKMPCDSEELSLFNDHIEHQQRDIERFSQNYFKQIKVWCGGVSGTMYINSTMLVSDLELLLSGLLHCRVYVSTKHCVCNSTTMLLQFISDDLHICFRLRGGGLSMMYGVSDEQDLFLENRAITPVEVTFKHFTALFGQYHVLVGKGFVEDGSSLIFQGHFYTIYDVDREEFILCDKNYFIVNGPCEINVRVYSLNFIGVWLDSYDNVQISHVLKDSVIYQSHTVIYPEIAVVNDVVESNVNEIKEIDDIDTSTFTMEWDDDEQINELPMLSDDEIVKTIDLFLIDNNIGMTDIEVQDILIHYYPTGNWNIEVIQKLLETYFVRKDTRYVRGNPYVNIPSVNPLVDEPWIANQSSVVTVKPLVRECVVEDVTTPIPSVSKIILNKLCEIESEVHQDEVLPQLGLSESKEVTCTYKDMIDEVLSRFPASQCFNEMWGLTTEEIFNEIQRLFPSVNVNFHSLTVVLSRSHIFDHNPYDERKWIYQPNGNRVRITAYDYVRLIKECLSTGEHTHSHICDYVKQQLPNAIDSVIRTTLTRRSEFIKGSIRGYWKLSTEPPVRKLNSVGYFTNSTYNNEIIKLLQKNGPMSSRDIIATFGQENAPMTPQQQRVLRTILTKKDHFVKIGKSTRSCLWAYKPVEDQHYLMPISKVYTYIIYLFEQNNGLLTRHSLQSQLEQMNVIPQLYEWWRVRLRLMLLQDKRFHSARKVGSFDTLWFYLPIFESNPSGNDDYERLYHVCRIDSLFYLRPQFTCTMLLQHRNLITVDKMISFDDRSLFVVPTDMICLNVVLTDKLILMCKPVSGITVYDEFTSEYKIIVTSKWDNPQYYVTIEIVREGEHSYFIICDIASSFLFRYVRIRNCLNTNVRVIGLYNDNSPLQFVRT
jgi:hypothetical protein